MPDAHFAVPRLAAIYDALDSDRSDLDPYLAMTEEFRVSTILDLGCGTGTFACLAAEQGRDVVAVDPAAAALDVARRKPGADRVRWIVGDANSLPRLEVDMVTMTANVAQVFLDSEAWATTLGAIHAALRSGGRLVFETRDPSKRAWQSWTRAQTHRRVDICDVGIVETWVDLTSVCLPLVSFRTTFIFAADGATLTSDSTLCFRDRAEITESLAAAGFVVADVRDAPDRPGLEMVFVAQKADERNRP